MPSITPSRFSKGQILSIDAGIAALLVIITAYIIFSAWSSIGIRAKEAQAHDELLSRTIAIADYLMKDKLVYKEFNPALSISSINGDVFLAYSHELNDANPSEDELKDFADRAGLKTVCVNVIRSDEPPTCGGYEVCIRRPIVIHGGGAGFLVVCAN